MGTTTVSIVGLVGFVVSGLFKSGAKPSSDKKGIMAFKVLILN